MKSYPKLIDALAEIEHRQWVHWMEYLFSKCTPEMTETKIEGTFKKTGNLILSKYDVARWKMQMKKKYKNLSEEEKESDREWAETALVLMPIKCPVHQCGGWMETKIRKYPKGMNEDDFPDGMPGDDQLPDLECTNCGAIYKLNKFKGKQ